MKLSLGSIRSKIWFCVSISLIGYCIATISGFYTNMQQYQQLAHLEQTSLPLSSQALKLLQTFEKQIDYYESSFLIGERELAIKGNNLQPEIVNGLTILISDIETVKTPHISLKYIQKLKKNYIDFAKIASDIYPKVGNGNIDSDTQKKIQHLGKIQLSLKKGFEGISNTLYKTFHNEIEANKARTMKNALFLATLFFIVLVIVTIIVDRISTRLLVLPLTSIGDNVKRYLIHKEIQKPKESNPLDEIGHLAMSFWDMTKQLDKTTVSKHYVDNIIRNMSGALVVVRPDRTIQTVNHQCVKMFGYTEEYLVGQPVDQLFSMAKDQKPNTIINDVAEAGMVKDVEFYCLAKDKKQFPVHFSGSAMHSDTHELQGIICIFNDITDLKNAEEKLTEMAHYDALTGLPNRNLFFDRLEQSLLDAKRHDRMFALLYLDLDKFKPINDTYGHDIGDMVLKKVSNRLLQHLRADDTVGRMGGDEFIIILNGVDGAESVEKIAEKVIQKVIDPFTLEGISHTLGVSVGISIFPLDGLTIDSLMQKSDGAMYEAKRAGGNRYSRYQK